ncbi:MAG: Calx-beta domain-containing protein [Kiritimatiellae bacterium]|nr:Calx-beta domain-containing protein [Kiritimatiellia bacterium]
MLRKKTRRIFRVQALAAGGLLLFALTAAAQLPPSLIFQELLNSDPGWSTQGDWAFGVPSGIAGDPSSGFTGSNVYGYNLAGAYSDNIALTHYLISPAIDCTDFTFVHLSFQRWLGIESRTWDLVTIDVSRDGSTWSNVWANPSSTISEWQWTNIIVDISDIADEESTVYIRWGLGPTDGSVVYCGWNLDDIELWGLTSTGLMADVSTSLREAEDPALRGGSLLYTFYVTNGGPNFAREVSASNHYPASVNILSATSSVGTCSISGSDVLCSIGDLAPQATAVVHVVTQPMIAGTVTVSTYAASAMYDLTPANNTAIQTTLISEAGGDLQFENPSYYRDEGSNVTLTVTRTGAFYGAVQVNYATSNGTAMAGLDYTHASGTLNFTSGATRASFTVTILDDTAAESEENFSVHLSTPGGGAALGSPDTASVTIRDEDGTASFPFTETFESGVFSNCWTTYTGTRGRIQFTTNYLPHAGSRHVTLDGNGSFTYGLNEIVLNIDLAGEQGVVLSFWQKEFSDEDQPLPALFTNHYNGDGVAISVNGTNWYTAQGLTSVDGISNTYRQFEVPLDGLLTSNGLAYSSQFKIKFQQYGYGPIAVDGFAFDDINLYALAGTLQFSTNALGVNEGETAVTVTVVRINGNTGEVAADYTAGSGTAESGFDFTAQTGVLTFAAGQMTNTFVIPILDDEDDEPTETILLTLSNPAGGAALGSLSSSVVSIIDDDGPGDFRFSQPDFAFSESVNVATLIVERINGLEGTASVNWSLAAGSAAPGADYADRSDILLFGDGQAGAEIEIEILDDLILESNETFTVWLHDPGGGAGLESPSNATVIILDNELAYFQGFEGSEEDNWNCTFYDGTGFIGTNSTRSNSGTNSLKLRGSYYDNTDPHVIFDNIDVSSYSNVLLSVAFSSSGPDTDDDLWLDLSYDDGLTWDGEGSIKLVDGYSNAEIPFGGTAGGEPLTVSNNPWTVAIPDAASQIRVRIRFDEKYNSNASIDSYFIDDIRLYFLPPDQPPVITAAGSVSALVSNLTSFVVTAMDIDHDPIALTADGLPAGAGFSVVTNGEIVEGTFTFTPDVTQAGGVYTSYFRATDMDGTVTQAVVISVFDKQVNILHAPRIVNEESGAFSITVSVSRAAGTAVSLQFSGTAEEGSDYTVSETSLYFAVNAPREQTVAISLNDDTLAEGLEKLTVSLTDVLNGEIGFDSVRTIDLRDNDSFTLASANLTTTGLRYKDPGNRILAGVRPDIIAIQEFNVTNGSHRAWVDQHLGEDYHYIVETNRSLPNGVISRWPIKDWGQWDDTQLSDREFVWATVDVPGDRDLHVISVHLYYSGGEDAREKEGRALTNYIATAGWDPEDFFALCGDFNSQFRQEAVVLVLTQMVSDIHKPADQLGDTDTNQNRDKPYDWVLPGSRLDAKHLPLSLNGESFPEGMVFDTRLWSDPPPPVLTSDSGAQDMQHMLVMKLFSLKTNFMILTTADGNGMVHPVNPEVAEAGEQPFTIAAAAYHHISGVRTNGGFMNIGGASGSLDFTWSNVTENSSLAVTFAENIAGEGVPEWWLAAHGWTGGFAEAVYSDPDDDLFLTWEEYHANTDPTNRYSLLAFESVAAAGPGQMVLSWQSASNRMYRLSVTTNGLDDFDVVDNAIPATPVMNVYTVQVISADGVIYRISIAP